MNFKRVLAVAFATISIVDLYLILATPMPFALFYAGFSLYFAYRAKQLWSESAQK